MARRFAPPARGDRASVGGQPLRSPEPEPYPRERGVARRQPGDPAGQHPQQSAAGREECEASTSSGSRHDGRHAARGRPPQEQSAEPQPAPERKRPAPRAQQPRGREEAPHRAAEEGFSRPGSTETSEKEEDEDSEDASKTPCVVMWEHDVLPMFYYNDLLASRPGDRIALNLFEPRYQEMCRRMAHDPRFLFMPNFEDYRCRVGDVGLIVRLSAMRQQGNGRSVSYGIQGFAEEYATVACTWVEPYTHGLHFARYVPLGPRLEPLAQSEFLALHDALVGQGWEVDQDPAWRRLLRRPAISSSRAEVLFGLNWPRCIFLLLRPDSRERDLVLLSEAWAAALPGVSRPRFAAADFAARAVHLLPPSEVGCGLDQLCRDLIYLLEHESPSARAAAGLPESGLPDAPTWQRLLSQARMCSVNREAAAFPNVQIGLHNLSREAAQDCDLELPPGQTVMRAFNGTNVHFYAELGGVQVTLASAKAAVASLTWTMSRLRLRILQRAHEKGIGPLAALEDDVLRLVCDFICPTPPS